MSIARPSQCLLCVFRRSQAIRVPRTRRTIHCTPSRRKDDSNDDDQPTSTIDLDVKGREAQKVPEKEWAKQYEPRQVEAIKAAQELIGDKFEKGKSIPRTDPWSVNYYDDFTKINPVADMPVRKPWTNLDDDHPRLRDSIDAADEFVKFEESLPPREQAGEDPLAIQRVQQLESMRLMTGKLSAELEPPSARMPTPIGRPKQYKEKVKKEAKAGGLDERLANPTPEFLRLMQMTGMSARQLLDLKVKTIFADRVANQTRLGKIYKMKFVAIAGNGEGLLGVGEGKADEPGNARLQAQYRAIRSMQPVRRYEQRTIFGTVNGKVGATELELYARPPGFGLRCQHLIWEMANCAGIYDLAARVTRARNPMNVIKAAYQALLTQKDPEEIARARGKKLVDVRKVYYAGQLPT